MPDDRDLSAKAEIETDQSRASSTPAVDEPSDADEADQTDPISPGVRRLVRQFNLDITGIQGTGPKGRIRVSDVIGLIDKTELPARQRESAGRPSRAPEQPELDESPPSPDGQTEVQPFSTTAIFECDLSRVLSHRHRSATAQRTPRLASYFVAAFAGALEHVPEVIGNQTGPLGIERSRPDGSQSTALADCRWPANASLDERLAWVDEALRAGRGGSLDAARLLVRNYAASGCLATSPLPIPKGHVATLGIGRARREIVVHGTEQTPRVATRCQITLSFWVDKLSIPRAHVFMALAVRTLESWPG